MRILFLHFTQTSWIFMTTSDSKKPLTLSGHHTLCVALGKHPHVSIETGLLHWRRNSMKNCYGWKWLTTQCEPERTVTPNKLLKSLWLWKEKYEQIPVHPKATVPIDIRLTTYDCFVVNLSSHTSKMVTKSRGPSAKR